MKARVKFSKTGSMRFIGHLDVMRYFQKAFRRGGIPISYSQGYSPHQQMSFTSPLGIGLTSDGEYLDIELESSFPEEKMVEQMNTTMNDEIRIKDFVLLPEEAKPSMAILAACDYVVCLKPQVVSKFRDSSSRDSLLEEFLNQKNIEISKKTKRSEKVVDIRENIYYATSNYEEFQKMTGQEYGTLSIDFQEMEPILFLQLTAGSIVNIKPELVMEALCQFGEVEFSPLDYQIHRLEMYGDEHGKKGEVHLLRGEEPCHLVPLSKYK